MTTIKNKKTGETAEQIGKTSKGYTVRLSSGKVTFWGHMDVEEGNPVDSDEFNPDNVFGVLFAPGRESALVHDVEGDENEYKGIKSVIGEGDIKVFNISFQAPGGRDPIFETTMQETMININFADRVRVIRSGDTLIFKKVI